MKQTEEINRILLPPELLDTPMVVDFWPSGLCNMRCSYCIHSLPDSSEEKKSIIPGFLSRDDFLRAAEDMGRFPRPVSAASFCGVGEPLTHPHLPEMIAYLKEQKLVSLVELTTNGMLLDAEMSDRLIEAGVDILNISVQGVTKEGYQTLCRVPFEPEKIAEHAAYYHAHKKPKTVLIARTLNLALPNEGDEQEFHRLFDSVSDQTIIANAVRLYQNMDYSDLIPEDLDQFEGGEMQFGPCCPLPFITLHIRPNGGIAVCPLPLCPGELGNIREMSLVEAWNSPQRLEILLAHASEKRGMYPECRDCVQPNMIAPGLHAPEGLEDLIRKRLEK